MRLKLLLPLLLLSSGCALLGCATTSLQTFDKIYTAALTTDDLVVQAATAALNAGLISSAQAVSIQKITTDASNLLMAANTAFTAGNSVAANQDVTAATATLVAMSLCLTAKPLTVATFAACAAAVPALPVAS
jgi:hypothetical protein